MRTLRTIATAAVLACAAALQAHAQDTRAWLASQGLEPVDLKTFQEFDAVVARVAGAKDATSGQERIVLLKQGKPVWQSNPRESEPGSRWAVNSIGRDLDGDGLPDAHFSSSAGSGRCCMTHHILRLKPQVKRIAVYSAGAAGGTDFIELPGRKAPVMVSADDAYANAFAPYANSYFPALVLEVGSHGRMQLASDLMQSKLPGQPPQVCALPVATANLWLKERCAEYLATRRSARTEEIKAKLAALKAARTSDKLKWEDYYESGVLAAVSAEVNRYAYTGHGNAGMNWLENVWPGNDAVKVRFVTTLRQTQSRSPFADDLKGLALIRP
jgi:hypothetical protein